MASYDLTAVLAKNLDKHLVFPLLEFLSMKKIYPEADIEKAKIELVQKTNMIDFLMDIWTSHYNKSEPPAEFQERRQQVVEKLSTLQASQVRPDADDLWIFMIQRQLEPDTIPNRHVLTSDTPEQLISNAMLYSESFQLLTQNQRLNLPSHLVGVMSFACKPFLQFACLHRMAVCDWISASPFPMLRSQAMVLRYTLA